MKQKRKRISRLKDMLNLTKHGYQALHKLLNDYSFRTVLDIGSGKGIHADIMETWGKEVTRLDKGDSYASTTGDNLLVGDYATINFEKKFSCIWCCHVLEHQLNPNKFLKKVYKDLSNSGVLAITVPNSYKRISGGHYSIWTGSLLLLHLAIVGFNCREASLKVYEDNISVLVVKRKGIRSKSLKFDRSDIGALRPYLPELLYEDNTKVTVKNITTCNW